MVTATYMSPSKTETKTDDLDRTVDRACLYIEQHIDEDVPLATVGREVGWHVRFDRRVSDQTRLTIATEGVLTAMLQQQQAVIEQLVDLTFFYYPEDAAHNAFSQFLVVVDVPGKIVW